MTNKTKHGGTTENESDVSKPPPLPEYGTQASHLSATGAPAQTVSTTQGIKLGSLFEQVDSIPLETMCSYWSTKFGFDWVKDVEVHKTPFDTLVCMRLERENQLQTASIYNPALDAHKNKWPQYTTTYRLRREYRANS